MDNLEDRRIELERAAFIAGEEVATKRIIAALRKDRDLEDWMYDAANDGASYVDGVTYTQIANARRAAADWLEREFADKAT